MTKRSSFTFTSIFIRGDTRFVSLPVKDVLIGYSAAVAAIQYSSRAAPGGSDQIQEEER